MRDEYRRGEFEARNRQLPADLDQSAPYNANARARADFDVTPVGTPPVCYDVRSVFDSRPVNTYDFHITQSGAFLTTNVASVVEMSVPEGYMAILRGIEAWIEPAPPGPDRSDVSMTVQLNGGDYPNNAGMLIGAATDGLIPMFLLADEFNRIGVRLVLPSLGFAGASFVHFYGNFVLKTDRAYPFEVANPSNDPLCKPSAQVRAPLPRTTPMPTPSEPVRTIAPTPGEPARNTTPIIEPPFRIGWRKGFVRDAKGLGAKGLVSFTVLIPVALESKKILTKTFTQKRDLTRAEIRQYLTFLDARVPPKERPLWENLLREIGVR